MLRTVLGTLQNSKMTCWLLLYVWLALPMGESAMANEFDQDFMLRNFGFIVDLDKVDRYKRKINYDEILKKLSPRKVVLVDWANTLKEFRDADGATWRTSDIVVNNQQITGNLKARLESEWGSIRIEIVSVPPKTPWVTTVDYALYKVSQLTNSIVLTYRAYKDYPGDLGLTSSYIDHSIALVYGNIFIEMDSWLHHGEYNFVKSIGPVAHYLQAAMEKAFASNPEGKLPARPSITYTANPTRVKAGETFTITAKFDGGRKLDPRSFDVAKDLISDNLEYAEDLGGGVFKFTAKSPGMGTVAFSLLDKKTLWVFTDSVTVHVDPAK